jgi:aminoglycoside phosphotransferase (APT) family kinase protein
MGNIDTPVDTRDGESFDIKKVDQFLKDKIPGLSGELAVKQFPRGFSNLTYLITIGDREMVLRKPPFGKKAKTAHDMSREYRILKALESVFPYSPKPLLYTDDNDIMGSSFYVMERIKGIILRKKIPKELGLTPDMITKLCESLMEVFCELHALDFNKIGLEDFGKPEGYVRRQVEGWSSRYRNARTDDAPDFENVMKWLHDKMPNDSQTPTIIHNDYKFDNVVLNPENPMEIIGVLDWEMSTIGDPLMDLGGSLAYWINHDDPDNAKLIGMLPTTDKGMLTRNKLVDMYMEKTGRKIETFDFYYCFDLFRLATIAQQIYYRFYHGQTKDERFAMLIIAVQVLEESAQKLIALSDI